MKTLSTPNSGPFCDLLNSLGCPQSFIIQAARRTGWLKRTCRKISPDELFHAICCECSQGCASFNDVASRIHTFPSRQAVAKRMNGACLGLFEQCLASLIARRLYTVCTDLPWLGSYQRILVQDSTLLKLPARLFDTFSGVSNATTAVCNARLQAVYDLKSQRFLAFSIDAYSKNDQRSAPELELRKGDLVLRDRGYLSADEIQRHLKAGAHCIYRHKTGNLYLDPLTGSPLDLLKELREHGCLDRNVQLNNKDRTVVRLLGCAVSAETASLRRMKAKKEIHGHSPSAEVLALMDWTLFITTISGKLADFACILAAYGLRWRIEVLFKSWKSHLHFDVIHQMSETQLRILLTARLLVITALTNWLYPKCQHILKKVHGRELSLLKFLNHLSKKPEHVGLLSRCLKLTSLLSAPLCRMLSKYCCYDLRKRKNFTQICDALT
jgi:hypothetical protein